MSVTVIIPGRPVGKQRARTVRDRTREPHSYTPQETVDHEALVAACYIGTMGRVLRHAGPVELEATFRFKPPPSWPLWKRKRAEAGERA